mmetsp:Transcript_138609/g.345703  ORF Transcript_138609/g.345703 Transcript_138609/m.345703 type:complete len:251 (-) Transcript_138609:56-808(-)
MAAGAVASSCVRRSGGVSSSGEKLRPDEPVCLRRFGLNFDPPSLVLEYERLSSGRLFHRRIGLRRLDPGADAVRTAEKLRRQNEALLAEDQVPFEQLVSVITRLQHKGDVPAEKDKAEQPKAAMAPSASKAEVEAEAECMTKMEPKRKAEEEVEQGVEDKEQEGKQAQETAHDESPRAREDEGVCIDGDMDLNKLSTEDLDKMKRSMDVEFFKNQVKPGDSRFQYDVRVDHVVDDDAASCGWDSDSEDDG